MKTHFQLCKQYGTPRPRPYIGIGDRDMTLVFWRWRFIIWETPFAERLYAWVSRRKARKLEQYYAECLRAGEIK